MIRSVMATIVKEIVNTPLAPKPIGPYSQAVIADRTMYISGQIGLDPCTGKLVNGGVTSETKQALQNLSKILEAAGLSYKNVVKCTVLLKNMDDFSRVNDIYKDCKCNAAYCFLFCYFIFNLNNLNKM
ncbi:2-iminobutanoate/2-iminopropanoate deaminase-like [Centruroides sculpturatus]|uniref:2-iminobutanoate/2-iminopropanoate deaminase-like n=1 Tax=Centruroides sculpturatus TaxID=218467 RepID=UPI000C6EF627|nr:2-iminobutanoate/2-iminopropanoate deaminase-like [Centruroides sculpturatus]